MMGVADGIGLEHDAEIPTWFGVGGRADSLARPGTVEDLRDLLLMHAGDPIRVLGDGANLLVDDDGVDGLVLCLDRLAHVDFESYDEIEPRTRTGRRPITVRAGGGAGLPRLVTESVRRGVSGLEGLGGIPASVGGAVFMNAGGSFGSIADAVGVVHAVSRLGQELSIPHDQIAFGYRWSGLNWLVITEVELELEVVPERERASLRQRLKDVMAYKKDTQPLADDSAGCVFKNPVMGGERVSAGMLIDRAGCKGLSVGGARVSERHANFIVVSPGGRARDVIELMERVRERVRAAHGVTLENEVAVWGRSGPR
jgi:UDP-N-acetylmuramate dehydrogenase